MQPLQADQAAFLLHGVHLPGLKNEHRITKNVIEAIPLDKGDYSPDDISMTALGLAWHIVMAENRFMDAVLTGAFDLSPYPMPESVKNSKDLAALYTQDFESRIEKLTALSND
jgi:hypothetical protein